MRINIFRGELTDNSAKKEALVPRNTLDRAETLFGKSNGASMLIW